MIETSPSDQTWESLSKHLQSALLEQMKETEKFKSELKEMEFKLHVAHCAIKYLEGERGHDSV
jgi:TRAP-type C4-dicarboxylate transport system substrate-binding protein